LTALNIYETADVTVVVGRPAASRAAAADTIWRVLLLDRRASSRPGPSGLPASLVALPSPPMPLTEVEVHSLLARLHSRDTALGGGLRAVARGGCLLGVASFLRGPYLVVVKSLRPVARLDRGTVHEIRAGGVALVPLWSTEHWAEATAGRSPSPEAPSQWFTLGSCWPGGLVFGGGAAPSTWSPPPADRVPAADRLRGALHRDAGAAHSKVDEMQQERKYVASMRQLDWGGGWFVSFELDLTRGGVSTAASAWPRMWPTGGFVWNEALAAPLLAAARAAVGLSSTDPVNCWWVVPLLRGAVAQALWPRRVAGRPVVATIVARRHSAHVGQRFQARGVDALGHAANHVEVEQILEPAGDASSEEHEDANEDEDIAQVVVSHVHVRASAPVPWSQDQAKGEGRPGSTGTAAGAAPFRPPFALGGGDPLARATRLHVYRLIARYGAPVICVDLLRTSPSDESELSDAYARAIDAVGAWLAADPGFGPGCLLLRRFDLSGSATRLGRRGALAALIEKLRDAVEGGGVSTWPAAITPAASRLPALRRRARQSPPRPPPPERQRGVVRVSCVDCIDRSFVAGFAVGLLALADQLKALGASGIAALGSPPADALARLHRSVADVLARQYAGSGAAHGEVLATPRDDVPAALPLAAWARLAFARWAQRPLRATERAIAQRFFDPAATDAQLLLLGRFRPRRGEAPQARQDRRTLMADLYFGNDDDGASMPHELRLREAAARAVAHSGGEWDGEEEATESGSFLAASPSRPTPRRTPDPNAGTPQATWTPPVPARRLGTAARRRLMSGGSTVGRFAQPTASATSTDSRQISGLPGGRRPQRQTSIASDLVPLSGISTFDGGLVVPAASLALHAHHASVIDRLDTLAEQQTNAAAALSSPDASSFQSSSPKSSPELECGPAGGPRWTLGLVEVTPRQGRPSESSREPAASSPSRASEEDGWWGHSAIAAHSPERPGAPTPPTRRRAFLDASTSAIIPSGVRRSYHAPTLPGEKPTPGPRPPPAAPPREAPDDAAPGDDFLVSLWDILPPESVSGGDSDRSCRRTGAAVVGSPNPSPRSSLRRRLAPLAISSERLTPADGESSGTSGTASVPHSTPPLSAGITPLATLPISDNVAVPSSRGRPPLPPARSRGSATGPDGWTDEQGLTPVPRASGPSVTNEGSGWGNGSGTLSPIACGWGWWRRANAVREQLHHALPSEEGAATTRTLSGGHPRSRGRPTSPSWSLRAGLSLVVRQIPLASPSFGAGGGAADARHWAHSPAGDLPVSASARPSPTQTPTAPSPAPADPASLTILTVEAIEEAWETGDWRARMLQPRTDLADTDLESTLAGLELGSAR